MIMKDLFTRLLIGVVVFGLAVGAAFGAGTIYGRNSVKAAQGAAAATLSAAGANQSAGAGTGEGSGAVTGAASGTTAAGTGRAFRAGTQGTPGAGAAAVQGSGAATGGASGFGGAGRAGVGGLEITGTVKAIDGQQLTITTEAGTDITVDLGDTAAVGTVQKSDKSAIKPGASVIVTGQRGTGAAAQGGQSGTQSPTASSVLLLPQGFQP